MIKNYLLIAVRNIVRAPAFTGINIVGLSIGIAGFLVIINYVIFERSYDKMHSDYENIYRIRVEGKSNSGEIQFQSARNFAAAGPEVARVFDEITQYTRLMDFETVLATEGDDGTLSSTFVEDNIMIADTSFFSVFDFPLIRGDRETVLQKAAEILISETSAIKYFGSDWQEQNILNKSLVTMDSISLVITGVFEDIPMNSHLKFDIILSFETILQLYGDYYHTNWNENSTLTYLKIRPGTDIKALESKFSNVIDKFKGDYFKRTEYREDFYLQPLESIHLYSDFDSEAEANGDGKSVFILLLIGIFVICIAVVNYMNLATARSLHRAKEVGVRKVSGASRRQLIIQFLSESIIITTISFILSYTLIQIFYPFFEVLIGKTIPLVLFSSVFWFGSILLFGLCVAFLAGIYPAFIISSYKPSEILKGKFSKSGKGSAVRKVLVTFQFTISIGLLAGTIAIYDQLRFMNSSNLGLNIENTIVLHAPEYYELQTRDQQHTAFKESLKDQDGILAVSNSRFVPGDRVEEWGGYIRQVGSAEKDAQAYNLYVIDDAFMDDYEVELLAGRAFANVRAQDTTVVMLSESASKKLGFISPEEAIGKYIYYPMNNMQDKRKIEVIGVTRNFHQGSLKEAYLPIIFQLQRTPERFISVKYQESKLQNVLTILKEQYLWVFGDIPFTYTILRDRYNTHYRPDNQFGEIFGVFTFLAIFIAGLGLFGLSTFLVVQKRKEIGIRKVLGATAGRIVRMLSSELVITILVASIIALPTSYIFIGLWLENYPNRIELGPLVTIVPPLVVLIVALLTVGTQTISVANSNPSDVLTDN